MENRKSLLNLQTIGRVELQTCQKAQNDPQNWSYIKNQNGIQQGRMQSATLIQEVSASRMQDWEELVKWTRTEEDPGVIKHCWLRINQPCRPALGRPNAKLRLINRRKDMQQVLFYSENRTCCSALVLVSPLLNPLSLCFLGRLLLSALQSLLQRTGNHHRWWRRAGWAGLLRFLRPPPALHGAAPRRGLGCLFCIAFFFFFSFSIWGGGPEPPIWQ